MNSQEQKYPGFTVYTPEQADDKSTIILFLGWMASTKRQQANYVSLYLNKNYTVIAYEKTQKELAIKPHNYDKKAVPKLLQVLKDDFPNSKIIVQVCSHFGALTLMRIYSAITEKKEFQFVLDNMIGFIWDSAPRGNQLVHAANAIGHGSTFLWYIVFIFFGISSILQRILKVATLGYVHDATDVYEHEKQLLRKIMKDKPQLYLFSKADIMCPWETVLEFVETQKKTGSNVDYIMWEDSPHVLHLRKYPEQYKAKVSNFIEKL